MTRRFSSRLHQKPQQKLFFLKNYLLTKHYHSLIFSRLDDNNFKKANVRHILHLLHDLLKVVFPAKVDDRGMGIPRLRFHIPIIAKKRLICRTPHPNLFRIANRKQNTLNQVNNYFKIKLYSSCDGAGLKESSKGPAAHTWLPERTGFLPGREFIQAVRVRYGVLFNRPLWLAHYGEELYARMRNC